MSKKANVWPTRLWLAPRRLIKHDGRMPQRPMQVSESVVIDVAPSVVWAAVSDPTQTARWSPENTAGRLDAATLNVGDCFVGANHRRSYRWVTRCRVTAAEPETRFAFRV